MNDFIESKKVFNTGETDESLKEEYNPEGSPLRRGQHIMTDMLKYIDELCRKHHIEYRLDAGNVLGAVRHNGFIPWDDDVDIALFRKDYFKLYRVLKKEHHDRFVLQDGHTDKAFFLYYIKLRDKMSHMESESNRSDKLTYDGFQIDIFRMIKGPITFLIKLDTIIDNHIEQKLRMRNKVLWKLFHLFMSNIVHPIFRLCSFIFGDKTVVGYDYGLHAFERVRYDSCYPYKPIKFENVMLMGPSNPHAYCIEMYGKGYNSLPPKEKRNHHQTDEYFFANSNN